MNHFNIIHNTIEVDAEVIKVGVNYWDDIICIDHTTKGEFILDAYVGAKNETKFNVGDKFKAVIHPVSVTFAVMDWIEK